MLMTVYLDDILLTNSHQEDILGAKSYLLQHFVMRDLHT